MLCSGAASAKGFKPNRLMVGSVGGGLIHELKGNGKHVRDLGDGVLDAPRGLAFGPDARLYVACGDRVVSLDSSGQAAAVIGAGSGMAAARGVAFGPGGKLFVSDGDRVRIFDTGGAELGAIGAGSGLGAAAGVAFDANGHLYVSSGGSNRIMVFDTTGELVREIGAGSSLAIPIGIAFGPDGLLYAASLFDSSVIAFNDAGEVVRVIHDDGLVFPTGLSFGPNGNLFVTALFAGRVFEFDPPSGALVRTLDVDGGILSPEGIAFAPTRFKCKLKGTLARPDEPAKKVKEKFTLYYAPGSRILMPSLKDGPKDDDIASVFGSSLVVLHGFEIYKTAGSKKRAFQGTQVATPDLSDGVASAELSFQGTLQSFGVDMGFLPKSGKGSFHRASAAGILDGKLRIKSVLK